MLDSCNFFFFFFFGDIRGWHLTLVSNWLHPLHSSICFSGVLTLHCKCHLKASASESAQSWFRNPSLAYYGTTVCFFRLSHVSQFYCVQYYTRITPALSGRREENLVMECNMVISFVSHLDKMFKLQYQTEAVARSWIRHQLMSAAEWSGTSEPWCTHLNVGFYELKQPTPTWRHSISPFLPCVLGFSTAKKRLRVSAAVKG